MNFVLLYLGLQTHVVSTRDSAVQCTLLQAPSLLCKNNTDATEQESSATEYDTGPEVDEDHSDMEDTSDLERYSYI